MLSRNLLGLYQPRLLVQLNGSAAALEAVVRAEVLCDDLFRMVPKLPANLTHAFFGAESELRG